MQAVNVYEVKKMVSCKKLYVLLKLEDENYQKVSLEKMRDVLMEMCKKKLNKT